MTDPGGCGCDDNAPSKRAYILFGIYGGSPFGKNHLMHVLESNMQCSLLIIRDMRRKVFGVQKLFCLVLDFVSIYISSLRVYRACFLFCIKHIDVTMCALIVRQGGGRRAV